MELEDNMLDLVRRGHSLRTVANSVKAMIMVGGDPDVLMRGIIQHAGLNDTCAVGLIRPSGPSSSSFME